jgi:hypothetical protein
VNAARSSPRFGLIGVLVDWLQGTVERAGVQVELDTFLKPADVSRYGAETVIVATGSTPRMDGLQPMWPAEPVRGVDQHHVLSSTALLADGVPDGAASALVLDTVGHFEPIAAAELLVSHGLALTYVTSLASFGGFWVNASHRDDPELEYLYDGDFTLLTRHLLVEIGRSSCVVRPLQSARAQEVPADVVVLVTQNEPNRALHDELVAAGHPDVRLIGDAASPRDLTAAIAEGHRLARVLAS